MLVSGERDAYVYQPSVAQDALPAPIVRGSAGEPTVSSDEHSGEFLI